MKTRLQVQIKHKEQTDPVTVNHHHHHHHHYESTLHAITKIIEDEGIHGLYAGFHGALIGVASTNFAYFYWYSVVRSVYLSTQSVPHLPNTAVELSLGAVAGALAQLFTIPVSVVTTRQQTQPKGDKKGMIDTAKEVIHSEDGWSGLWRGLKASLVLVVNPAITYGTYQRLKEVIFPDHVSLRPWEAFRKFSINTFPVPKLILMASPGRYIEILGNHRHPASHSGQGRPPVATTSCTAGKAFQVLYRGDGIHPGA